MSALLQTTATDYAETALHWVCGIVERGALGRVTIADYPSLAALWDDVSQKRVMASKLDALGFCPGVTQPGPRDAKHAQPWPFLVLDVEGKCEGSGEAKHLTGKPAPSVTETAGRIRAQGWQACIYTTFEHGHAYGPRYRVLIALDSPVPPGEIRRAVEAVAAALRLSEFVDFTCTDPARFFYVASCPKERADLFERVMIEGSPAKLAELLAAPKIAPPPPTPPSPPPGRADESVIDAFNQAHDIGAILERHGYRPTAKDRWIAPQSSSGEPGVHLLDSGRIFSHHDNDPLKDPKGHDAFSAWCVLDHGGNQKQAVRAAAQLLGMSYTPEQRAQKDFATDVAVTEQEPLDPFIERPVPPFPLAVLPDAMREYVRICSAGSGFDAGAYGFAVLVAASGLIDHRCKLRAGPVSVPPHLWGSLSAASGGGKSPVISAVKIEHESIHRELLRESKQRYAEWAAPPPREREGPPPDIRQLLIQDTTTEGAARVLNQNPRGVVAFFDELSEWLGRMDAYSGKGADKDRGVWIRAYDGGPQTINRATDHPVPLNLENFSVAMLAGVQPEKLAQMFQKSGAAASDGLFQRFLTYRMRPAAEVDYFASQGTFDTVNFTAPMRAMFDWWRSCNPFEFTLDRAALELAQSHHNTLRKLAQRTPPGRFAEHIDKLPGLTLRVALVLHCLHSAAAGVAPLPTVPRVRFEQAQAVIQCLYKHAEASYSEIDRTGVGQAVTLAKSACEAILSKRWMQFNRGDLTRAATGWQAADYRSAEAGLDLLIEWGWIVDITPTEPGKRGRPSSGRFAVIQSVHDQFAPYAERIKRERQERHTAIQQLARERQLVE